MDDSSALDARGSRDLRGRSCDRIVARGSEFVAWRRAHAADTNDALSDCLGRNISAHRRQTINRNGCAEDGGASGGLLAVLSAHRSAGVAACRAVAGIRKRGVGHTDSPTDCRDALHYWQPDRPFERVGHGVAGTRHAAANRSATKARRARALSHRAKSDGAWWPLSRTFGRRVVHVAPDCDLHSCRCDHLATVDPPCGRARAFGSLRRRVLALSIAGTVLVADTSVVSSARRSRPLRAVRLKPSAHWSPMSRSRPCIARAAARRLP